MGRISYKRRIFRNEAVERFAEDDGGIYIIQKNNEIVFIGEAGSLRKNILKRLSGMQGHQIQLSFYSCNVTDFNPSVKAVELLQKHMELYGTMPECNKWQQILDPYLVN